MPADQRPVDDEAAEEEFFGQETYWTIAPPPPPSLGMDDRDAGDPDLEQMLAAMMEG